MNFNNISITHPDLLEEWHPSKNGDRKPEDFSYGSGERIVWQCKKDARHVWPAIISNRARHKTGCPYCSGRMVLPEDSLAAVFPELAKEWHPTRNKGKTPWEVAPKSNKPVYWLCNKCGKELHDKVCNRARYPTGCRCKSVRIIPIERTLRYKYPDKAKEWHPTENGDRTPDNVSYSSAKEVWWLCTICGNEHRSKVSDKVKATSGCPECTVITMTSHIEFRIYTELKTIFDKVVHKDHTFGKEIDIYIPKYKLAIEYDSHFWHKDKLDSDIAKHKHLQQNGITVLRVIDDKRIRLYDTDVLIKYSIKDASVVKDVLKSIQELIVLEDEDQINVNGYIATGRLRNNTGFVETIRKWLKGFPIKTLAEEYPDIAKSWDYKENYPFTPDMIHPGINESFNFICDNGHSTLRWPRVLIKGHRCSKCYNQIRGLAKRKEESFGYLYPKRASYWDYEKNRGLTPFMVKPKSDREISLKNPETRETWKTRVRSLTASGKDTYPSPSSSRKNRK